MKKNINQPKETKSPFQNLSQIIDKFETIEVNPIGDPTFTPKGSDFKQSIKIVVDSLTSPTARRLYIYSFELKDWLYTSLST